MGYSVATKGWLEGTCGLEDPAIVVSSSLEFESIFEKRLRILKLKIRIIGRISILACKFVNSASR